MAMIFLLAGIGLFLLAHVLLVIRFYDLNPVVYILLNLAGIVMCVIGSHIVYTT